MFEADNQREDIVYSLVSKVWVVTKVDFMFCCRKSKNCRGKLCARPIITTGFPQSHWNSDWLPNRRWPIDVQFYTNSRNPYHGRHVFLYIFP